MQNELTVAEKEQMRTNSLFAIDQIVSRFGGSVKIDLETNSLIIDVPPGKELACAREIDSVIDPMCKDYV